MTENSSFLPGDDIHEDVEGHGVDPIVDPPEDVDDGDGDVEGHMQPPRDLDIERF